MKEQNAKARALALIAFAILALPACRPPATNPASAAESPPSLPDTAEVRRSSTSGALERVRGEDLSAAVEQSERFRAARENGDYGAMALAFLDAFRGELDVEDPLTEFSVARVNVDEIGFHQVRLHQSYLGLPVLGAELIVHFDREDRIYLVEGHYLPTPADLSVDASLSEKEAREMLAGALGNDVAIDEGTLAISMPTESTAARPVFRFEVRAGLADRREILLDAETGRVLRDVPFVLNGR